MSQGYVFSWAENANGKMVHIDSVPRGLRCGCICPYCHETLLARHGDIREHGFAHHSDRGANLEICYMVSLYKLAEQIIQTNKRIHAPSYYDIYKDTDIEFVDVKVDSRFEREDKQPDVIAVTNDRKKYLIEFVFKYKVQHKQAIDYKDLSCIEIDISNQSLESLENFLLSSKEGRKWINNEIYFNGIEEKYRKAGKPVKVVLETDCLQCDLRHTCCAVMKPQMKSIPLSIENSGHTYRLCKIKQYKDGLEIIKNKRIQDEQWKQYYLQKRKETIELRKTTIPQKREFVTNQEIPTSQNLSESNTIQSEEYEISEKSCFDCRSNLTWANKGKFAVCGCYKSLRLPKQQVIPSYAEQCKNFMRKKR